MNGIAQWLFGKPHATKGEIFSVLDIGSSKIACFIARVDENGQPHVVGIGHQLAEGVRGGLISDMELVQRAINAAVATAEQMAGETIERVIVNVSGPLLSSQIVNIELPLNGREITDNDIQRVLAQGQTLAPEDSQGHALELIHTLPVHYALDGQKGISDPLGMIGHLLNVQLHLISAAFGPVRTLVTAVARCHLEVEKLVATPYASGLACLVEDEIDLGSIIIDIGAGTTSFGVFFDGHMVYADGISVGGSHITSDIARGLTTSLAHAERLKTLYGSAILSQMDERELIDVPQIGEEAPEHANHAPKAQLIRIIQPRLEEIFEMVRSRLNAAGVNEISGRRVVLTGGTSQLPGIRDVAQRILDRQVRLGRPMRISRPYANKTNSGGFTGLAEATSGPAFSTTAGLLSMAMSPDPTLQHSITEALGGNLVGRFGQWVKQSL
ncbi:MAG: cell division protein FtsA [Alphaproteobacteria bacterium]|nr:cell division protein FtsA [Alphaproteobacteria bacterium]